MVVLLLLELIEIGLSASSLAPMPPTSRHGFTGSFEVVPIHTESLTLPNLPLHLLDAAHLRRPHPYLSLVPPSPTRSHLVPIEQACQFGDPLALDRLFAAYFEWSGDAAAAPPKFDSTATVGAGALNVNSLPIDSTGRPPLNTARQSSTINTPLSNVCSIRHRNGASHLRHATR